MTDIEHKEIRGLNLRILISFITSTAVICYTVINGYSNIVARIDALNTKTEVQQVSMNSMKEQINNLQIQINQIRDDLRNKQDKSHKE